MAPTTLKGNDVIPSINRWETRVQLLRGRHDEELREQPKIAILIGMMPKEYQDMVFQNGPAMMEDAMNNYQRVRDFIVNVSNQKLQSSMPPRTSPT